MKPLLVGECNPYGSDPKFALYPRPRGAAGHRLCMVMGLREHSYLQMFDRANLCTGKWSAGEAHRTAWQLMKDSEADPKRVFVLLGTKVTRAFFLSVAPFQVIYVRRWADVDKYPRDQYGAANVFVDEPVFTTVVLPHPSGRCRAWNEPRAVPRAREALVRAGVLGAA